MPSHASAGPPRVGESWWRRRADPLTLLGLLLVAVAVHLPGMSANPVHIDDEGTYVAQAWSLLTSGSLGSYTYWYDHPPLGWIQLAGYAGLTGAFGRHASAVDAGREAMLVAHLISVTLLWLLGRRLALPRWAAAGAVLLYCLSPLAVTFHRQVYLDNIAVPWLLAALVLALSPRRHLSAFIGSGLCLAVATLTKETFLLLLPTVGWLLWQRSSRSTRRYSLTCTVAVFVLALAFYPLYALIKGELLPGRGHVSLVGAVQFQLSSRTSSGWVLDPGSLAHRTVAAWFGLDPTLLTLILAAAVAALLVRRLRPLALGVLLLAAVVLRPGYLPMPLVIAALPLGCVLIGAVLAEAVTPRPKGPGVFAAQPVLAVAAGVAVLVAAWSALPSWRYGLPVLLDGDADRPMSQATQWIELNVPHGDRMIVDNALWVDLVRAGYPRQDVVWFYKPDTDGMVRPGWPSYQWIVSTRTVRDYPDPLPTVAGALAHSTPVMVFGSGDSRVEIRRTAAWAADTSADAVLTSRTDRQRAGTVTAANPALRLTPAARASLRSGHVDGRLLTLLAELSSSHRLAIVYFPADRPAGSISPDVSTGAVILQSVDGAPATGAGAMALVRSVADQQDLPYRPQLSRVTYAGAPALQLTLPLPR